MRKDKAPNLTTRGLGANHVLGPSRLPERAVMLLRTLEPNLAPALGQARWGGHNGSRTLPIHLRYSDWRPRCGWTLRL